MTKEDIYHNHPLFFESDRILNLCKQDYLNYFTENKDCVFLDLGCNNGEFTIKIAQKINTKNVYGLDILDSAIKASTQKGIIMKKVNLNNKFPFQDNMFDIISANQVVEHLYDTENFFIEINRLLKLDGYAIVSTINLSSFHSLFFLMLGQQSPVLHPIPVMMGNFLKGTRPMPEKEFPPHYKAFNFPVLKDLATYYGFAVEKMSGVGFYFIPTYLQKMFGLLFKRYSAFITMKIKKVDVVEKWKK